MSAVSPMVLLLLAVALLVAIASVLVGTGRLPATMEPPPSPWARWRGMLSRWPRRRSRREDAPANGDDEQGRADGTEACAAPDDLAEPCGGTASGDRTASGEQAGLRGGGADALQGTAARSPAGSDGGVAAARADQV